MQFLRSIAIDATPSIPQLIRFALLSLLNASRSVLMMYPVNVGLFGLAVWMVVGWATSSFRGRRKFRATYLPLQHRESSLQELKFLKKEVREVQGELIAMLKKNKENAEESQPIQPSQPAEKGMQPQHKSTIIQQLQDFKSQVQEKSMILQQVELQLKQTVSQAYAQLSKLNSPS